MPNYRENRVGRGNSAAAVKQRLYVLVLDVFLSDTSFFLEALSVTDGSPSPFISSLTLVCNDVIHCLSLLVCQCLQWIYWPKSSYFHIAKKLERAFWFLPCGHEQRVANRFANVSCGHSLNLHAAIAHNL